MKKIIAIVKRFLQNNCSLHAAGLTYFALLAVMPVLCCILVLAKACHVDEYAKARINTEIDAMIVRIEDGQNDKLISYLPGFSTAEQDQKRLAAKEFATQAREISNTLFSRVDNFDIGTFGWIGFGFLLWTVISSLASVEDSFNAIFEAKESRPIWKRAYMYLLIMIVLPVLAAVAMSLPILNVAKVLDLGVIRLALTLVLSTMFFAFFYWLIPNCKVQWKAAIYGGALTALLFGGWLKLCAIAQVGIAKSSALYGSFAFLPIVLAWLYMSWQIVLIGACTVKELEK